MSNMSSLIIRKQVSNILLSIFTDLAILSNGVKMHKRLRAVCVCVWGGGGGGGGGGEVAVA